MFTMPLAYCHRSDHSALVARQVKKVPLAGWAEMCINNR
jgi:hypothetical protein